MKTKEQILTEYARANGLRLNDSDWGDWLLKAMDIYAAQEVKKATAEHEAKTLLFAEWISRGMWTKYEHSTDITEVDKWYNTYRYSAMDKPLTTHELWESFLNKLPAPYQPQEGGEG